MAHLLLNKKPVLLCNVFLIVRDRNTVGFNLKLFNPKFKWIVCQYFAGFYCYMNSLRRTVIAQFQLAV